MPVSLFAFGTVLLPLLEPPERELPPQVFEPGETAGTGAYFFLLAACLSATTCCFFCSALLVLDCFCEDFF